METRPAELPILEHQALVEKNVQQLGGRIKHCARNAYAHLRKSWTIKPSDNEMSLFRAITAEEEAATALMLALKQQRYPHADKLRHHDHLHKSAIFPFIVAVSSILAKSNVPEPKLRISKEGRPRIALALDVGKFLGCREPLFAEPDHPLNFVMSLASKPNSAAYMFDEELRAIAYGRGLKDIVEYVEREANLRNRILYADDSGVPNVEFADSEIVVRLRRVHIMNCITIIILQTKDHQLFAVQCLEAFLRALRRIGAPGFDFEAATAGIRFERLNEQGAP